MKKSILYMLIAAFFLSFTEICLKALNGAFNPIQLGFSRYLVSSLVLLPVAFSQLRHRGITLTRRQIFQFVLLGFIGITVTGPLYQLSAGYLNAGVTNVIFSSNPLFTTLLSALLLGEAVNRRQWAAIALDLIGICIIIDPLHITLNPLGLAFLFSCIFTFSLFGVLGKKLSSQLGSACVTSMCFLTGGLELLLLAFLSYLPPVASALTSVGLTRYARIPLFTGYTLQNLPWVLLLFVGVTAFGHLCWFLAMEAGGVQVGSLTYFVKPALGPLLAVALLGETISLRMGLGILCILCGAAVALLPALLHPNKASS